MYEPSVRNLKEKPNLIKEIKYTREHYISCVREHHKGVACFHQKV